MIYKYLAYGGMGLALLIIGGLFGWHLGELSSAKKLAEYQAASETAVANAKTAASVAQYQADQAAIAQAKATAAEANQAVLRQQAASEALQATISGLRSQVAANAKGSKTVATWISESIPNGALVGLCFPQHVSDICTHR